MSKSAYSLYEFFAHKTTRPIKKTYFLRFRFPSSHILVEWCYDFLMLTNVLSRKLIRHCATVPLMCYCSICAYMKMCLMITEPSIELPSLLLCLFSVMYIECMCMTVDRSSRIFVCAAIWYAYTTRANMFFFFQFVEFFQEFLLFLRYLSKAPVASSYITINWMRCCKWN